MINLSKGNKKLNKGFLIWNLPAKKTCPGCTEMCSEEGVCYALQAEELYPDCLPSREFNYQTSLEPSFKDDMMKEVTRQNKSYRTFRKLFRIHESGDFYNAEYFEIWKEVARAHPDINFLAFTKSFIKKVKLDFTNIPPNLQVIMSIFPDTKEQPPEGFPKAYAGDCEGIDWSKTLECPGLCDTCGMCWQLSKTGMNVHFKMHGKRKNKANKTKKG